VGLKICVVFSRLKRPYQIICSVIDNNAKQILWLFWLLHLARVWISGDFSRITSTKSPPFCMTTFSASLTNLTALLPQSHDRSCHVSRPILAPPPLWLQKHTDLRAHEFAHSPDWWHQHRLDNVTWAWCWRPCEINPAIPAGLRDITTDTASSLVQHCRDEIRAYV
jgi:hypothetical protein